MTQPAPVLVVDYDPGWNESFEVIKGRVAAAIGRMAAAIEHIGSTAVPGLAAKPIIYIDILLAFDSCLRQTVRELALLGYRHQGDLGIVGREAFESPAGDLAHNLYVCHSAGREFYRHIAFRDYLRAHPDVADAYGNLKRALAMKYCDDRIAYTIGKHDFIVDLLRRALMESPEP